MDSITFLQRLCEYFREATHQDVPVQHILIFLYVIKLDRLMVETPPKSGKWIDKGYGLVEARHSPYNRKNLEYYLTTKGQEVVARLNKMCREFKKEG